MRVFSKIAINLFRPIKTPLFALKPNWNCFYFFAISIIFSTFCILRFHFVIISFKKIIGTGWVRISASFTSKGRYNYLSKFQRIFTFENLLNAFQIIKTWIQAKSWAKTYSFQIAKSTSSYWISFFFNCGSFQKKALVTINPMVAGRYITLIQWKYVE